MTPLDYAERLIFAPWDFARAKGYWIGWPVMVFGAVWVLVLMLPVFMPCLLWELLKDIAGDLRRRR